MGLAREAWGSWRLTGALTALGLHALHLDHVRFEEGLALIGRVQAVDHLLV